MLRPSAAVDLGGEAAHRGAPLSSAASRSAIRSPGASMPTDSRSRSSGTGEDGPSEPRLCSIRLSTPPSEVARLNTRTAASTSRAAPAPPATRMDSMPPNPPFICRAAISWPGWSGSPG